MAAGLVVVVTQESTGASQTEQGFLWLLERRSKNEDNLVILSFSFRPSALKTSMLSSLDTKAENDTFRYHGKFVKYVYSPKISSNNYGCKMYIP